MARVAKKHGDSTAASAEGPALIDPTKGWFSAQELAGLSGMPATDSAVMRAAKKNFWANRRKLRGKGFEYALTALPAETQKQILGLVMNQSVEAVYRSAQLGGRTDFLGRVDVFLDEPRQMLDAM